MRREGRVRRVLAERLHALPLVVEAAAPHLRPRVVRHPRLDDELRPQVHAADLVEARVPSPADWWRRCFLCLVR